VIYNDQQANFSQQSNATLTINFPIVFGTGKKDSVSIYYHGVPPVSGDFYGRLHKINSFRYVDHLDVKRALWRFRLVALPEWPQR
jgi:hypothetical protein